MVMNNLKLILLIPTLLSFLTSYSQIIEIKNDVFEVSYSEKLEQPLKVKYLVKCTNGKFSRSGLDFVKDKNVHTSDNDDYRNNVWDKGHMAPAAAFSCNEETLRQTFSYLNCSLQHESLNRGPWKSLEGLERDLAFLYGEVKVIIEVIFSDESEELDSGATVPDAFRKTIIVNNDSFSFYFENKNVKGIDWTEFFINN
jgi:endonuclease G